MKQYTFIDELAKSIVKGIMSGYKSYLYERKQKKEELVISSAYAWVKGNHIDHYVAQESEAFGIRYIPSKAGYSWGYLQFQNIDDNVLFLIKSSSAISMNNSVPKGNREDNYIEKLAKINKDLDFTTINANESEQLELRLFDAGQVILDTMEDEAENLSNLYNRFYIITYTLDEEKMISNISLCLPHPETYDLYQVDSWNRFFDEVDIDFSEEDFSGIRDDKEIETQVSIGDYGIVIGDKDKASDTES